MNVRIPFSALVMKCGFCSYSGLGGGLLISVLFGLKVICVISWLQNLKRKGRDQRIK